MAIDLAIQAHPILSRYDFDGRKIKKAMRIAGRMVRKDSRIKLAVKSAKNRTGGRFPGVLTGSMKRSIYAKVSRSGYSVGIAYNSTERTEKRGFYPAFLLYGVKGRIKPYDNPIQDAIADRREEITQVIRDAIETAMKPGVVKLI